MNTPYIIERSDESLYLFRLHNDILQTFTELGIAGGILLLLVFTSIIFPGIKVLTSNTDETENSFFVLAGLILAVLSSLTHALVDFPFHKPSSLIQFWIWAGLITALYTKKSNRFTISAKSLLSSSLVILSTLYITIMVVFYSAYITSNYHFYRAEQSIKSNNCVNAITHIEKSVSRFGFYFIAHNARINIHIHCNNNPQQLFNLLTQELMRDHSNTQALLKRAELLYANNYLEKAAEDYIKVIKILPHRPAAKVGLANVYISNRQYDKALALLKKSLEEHPGNKSIIDLLARVNPEE